MNRIFREMDHQTTNLNYARSRTGAARDRLDIHRWVSMGAVYLSAASMVMLAITSWRAVDATLARDTGFHAQQREFNHELVAAIEGLADKTGMLTSADYCPVRFRMRFPSGGVLVHQVESTLERLSSESNDREWYDTIASSPAGLIEYGLRPPGRYRLQLETAGGMKLEHEFDVLPGVPIDRVVICPFEAHAAESPIVVEVVVDWPAELESDDLLALIEIAPGPFETSEWRWEPVPGESLHALAAADVDQTSTREVIQRLQSDGFFAGDPESNPHLAAAVPVPYRFCQVRGITFVHRHLDDQSHERCHILGTLVYGQSEQFQSSAAPCWQAAGPVPVFEANPTRDNRWAVVIPPDCVEKLLERMREAGHSWEIPA